MSLCDKLKFSNPISLQANGISVRYFKLFDLTEFL